MNEPIPLFDLPEPKQHGIPRSLRHGDMVRAHGFTPGQTCGTCVHLEKHHMGSVWFKCAESHPTSSSASDWRCKWEACGLWTAIEQELPFSDWPIRGYDGLAEDAA